MDECDGRPLNTVLKDIHTSIINDIWYRPVIRWFIVCMTTIGTTIMGVSMAYILGSESPPNIIYTVFALGLCCTSFLIISLTVLITLRLYICLTSFTAVDSTPTARAPVFAADDRTGRPKYNSPLSVLHAV